MRFYILSHIKLVDVLDVDRLYAVAYSRLRLMQSVRAKSNYSRYCF